jgi:type II secretory pathway pseudopilin PulG
MRPNLNSARGEHRDPLRKQRRRDGIALLEILVAILILGIGAVAAISGLVMANGQAAINRTRDAGLALCQERIDQVIAASFSPPNTIPSCFGNTWPVPATDTATSTESVQLYADPNGGGTVTGTRTTLVSLGNATLNLVRVTARVNYTYRGKNYVCETFTLRSPD